MLEFFKAAFPWIVMGLAIAVLAVNHANAKKQGADRVEDDEKKPQENRMSEGLSLGMCLGVVLGVTGVCDLATGIGIGMLLGMVIGMSVKK